MCSERLRQRIDIYIAVFIMIRCVIRIEDRDGISLVVNVPTHRRSMFAAVFPDPGNMRMHARNAEQRYCEANEAGDERSGHCDGIMARVCVAGQPCPARIEPVVAWFDWVISYPL